ncbi:Dipeptide-binding ABC transporter, periplasmic substrate-binding component [Candidatus Syntrophocurvum alkaliphilum]|uniref:Dipeptide-binding ABC transporter, periplasmic substrate-binding component n=1 Tax=Candidatus Syntrophocurvum alkaliphilum TaxID=2293317 RepID=A0A6I6DC36_9FIRM|nr:ABC transporter substrate-binding protein [Candidatus Syntrophocurvum alkaliphilum]QGU00176.1 Dipeptide-binding ABC transporter, periplasmic substrate-binding component [Candidatus Syntrophocurvum alkaliphilum]
MFLDKKKMALLVSIIGLALLIGIIIHIKNQTLYTASLDTRPFNIGLVGNVETFEPANVFTQEEKILASTMYESLVYYDESSKSLKPLLATDWKYSGDSKTITININTNIRFHNGKLLTAQDVKDSWEYNFSTTKDWDNINLLMPISGSKERLEGKTADIAGIQAIDKRTLKIELNEPNAAFMHYLTHPLFYVFDTQDEVEPAVGTGPFIFKEENESGQIILEINDRYHRGLPKIASINVDVYEDVFQAFGDYKAGKLDYLNQVPLKEVKNLKDHSRYKDLFINRPLYETYSLGFNINKAPFADNYLLRRALNYGIDRDVIIETVLGDSYRASKGVIPFGLPGYNNQMPGYSYNPDKAKELLEEAGYPLGEGLSPLTLTINKNDGHRMVALTVIDQLAQLGIEVQLQEMDWDYYKKQLNNMSLSFFRISWKADYPDADTFLYNMFHSSQKGKSNFSGYHNQQVDKILDASRAETKSVQERVKLLNRAEEIIIDDSPFLWLFQKESAAIVGENVRNLTLNGLEMVDWYKVELLKPSLDDNEKPSTNGEV